MPTDLLTYPGFSEGTVADLGAFLRYEASLTPPEARPRAAQPARRPAPARRPGRPLWVRMMLALSAVLTGLGLASGFVAAVVLTVGLGLWTAGCFAPVPAGLAADGIVWVEGTPAAEHEA